MKTRTVPFLEQRFPSQHFRAMTIKKTLQDTTERKDVYSWITAQIVKHLEKGVRPWIRPWNAEHAAGRITWSLGHNGQPYSGINILSLLDVGPEPELCRTNLDDLPPTLGNERARPQR